MEGRWGCRKGSSSPSWTGAGRPVPGEPGSAQDAGLVTRAECFLSKALGRPSAERRAFKNVIYKCVPVPFRTDYL